MSQKNHESDWLFFFIFKKFGFSDLGIFRPLAPLARFVWVRACVNFALLRKHLVRFFSNIFLHEQISCFGLLLRFVSGFFHCEMGK